MKKSITLLLLCTIATTTFAGCTTNVSGTASTNNIENQVSDGEKVEDKEETQDTRKINDFAEVNGHWVISKVPNPFTSGLGYNFSEDQWNVDGAKKSVFYTNYNFENLPVATELKDGLLQLSWEDPNEKDIVSASLELSSYGTKLIGTFTRIGVTVDMEFEKTSNEPNLGAYNNTIYTRAAALLNKYDEYKEDGAKLNFTYDLGLRERYLPLIDAYQLDEVTKGLEDVELMTVLLNWVCDHVPHDGAAPLPDIGKRDAISLIDFNNKEKTGLNCRGVSIILSELCNLYGIPSRYITCLEETGSEAHVVAEAYSKKYNQWVMLDPTFRLVAKDKDGKYINLQSFRKMMAADEDFFPNSNVGHNDDVFTKQHYKEFFSKYLVFFGSSAHFTFNTEATTDFYGLLPAEFDKSTIQLPPTNVTLTTSDKEFWKLPTE